VKIEAGAHALPTTYQGKDGKQCVAIAERAGVSCLIPLEPTA
jgi:hypothetical protein